MPETFTTENAGQTVCWTVSKEDEDLDRWNAQVKLESMTLGIDVLVPSTATPDTYLADVCETLDGVSSCFDDHIDQILEWYRKQFPNKDADTFKAELLQSATLFLDFAEEHIERKLIFWETKLQYFAVPIAPDGRANNRS